MTTQSSKTAALRLGAVLALVLGLTATGQPAEAQSTDLVFSVTEGVTYQATPKEIRDKFEPLAEVIGKALRRNVRIVLVPAYDDARAGLARQEYDLAFVHPAHVSMAGVHRVASLIKRWILGTHHGSVQPAHLDAYLDEFVFRFNRRTSSSRGMLFYRLLQQAVVTDPVTYDNVVRPLPKAAKQR